MFVSTKNNFIFVAITKTGSESMIKVLNDNFEGKILTRTGKIPTNYHHLYSFAVVRNPYMRMVSWWWAICKSTNDRYGHKKELRNLGLTESLEDFLILFGNKKVQQAGYFKNNNIDKVLKLENINDDFHTLPFINKKYFFPKINNREHPPWQELLDDKSREIINHDYKEDFELFGYKIDVG